MECAYAPNPEDPQNQNRNSVNMEGDLIRKKTRPSAPLPCLLALAGQRRSRTGNPYHTAVSIQDLPLVVCRAGSGFKQSPIQIRRRTTPLSTRSTDPPPPPNILCLDILKYFDYIVPVVNANANYGHVAISNGHQTPDSLSCSLLRVRVRDVERHSSTA